MADTDNTLGATEAIAVPAVPAAAAAAKSKLPLIAGALAVLVLAGAGWYFGMHLPAQRLAEEESGKSVEKRLMKQLERKKDNKPPVFITMDEFLVNLPGKGGEHYLQTKIVLRTADNTTEKRITDFLPLVRDRVLAAAAVGLLPAWARLPLRLPYAPVLEGTAVRLAGTVLVGGIRWALAADPPEAPAPLN